MQVTGASFGFWVEVDDAAQPAASLEAGQGGQQLNLSTLA